MTEGEMKHGWLRTQLKSRILMHLIMFSTVVNGAISVHAHSHEVQVSGRKWAENPGQVHPRDHFGASNETICNGDGSPATEFDLDRVLGRVSQNDIEEVGRSLKFKLGERVAFRRRLQFALLPIMYKMGVMTTLLTGLTVLVLKGLAIGVILLIFAFGNYFTKLHKHSFQSTQPIHVHVHSQDGHSKVASFPYTAAGPWDRLNDEVHPAGPWDRLNDEVHPAAFLRDEELESYRRRLIQNSAALLKSRPLVSELT